MLSVTCVTSENCKFLTQRFLSLNSVIWLTFNFFHSYRQREETLATCMATVIWVHFLFFQCGMKNSVVTCVTRNYVTCVTIGSLVPQWEFCHKYRTRITTDQNKMHWETKCSSKQFFITLFFGLIKILLCSVQLTFYKTVGTLKRMGQEVLKVNKTV